MAQVKITVRKNGPYRVEAPEGTIEMVDADGNKYDLTGKPVSGPPPRPLDEFQVNVAGDDIVVSKT